MTTILRIDASARREGSFTRQITDELIAAIARPEDTVMTRDLLSGIPLLTEAATNQLASPVEERTPDAAPTLAMSDELIEEFEAADAVVISVPIYNFAAPAALKAWADLFARAGRTFTYTENGPVGLLADRPVYIVAGAGGVPIGSPMDYSTPWLEQFLAFLGVTSVQAIKVEGLASDPEAGVAAAQAQIAQLASALT